MVIESRSLSLPVLSPTFEMFFLCFRAFTPHSNWKFETILKEFLFCKSFDELQSVVLQLDPRSEVTNQICDVNGKCESE